MKGGLKVSTDGFLTELKQTYTIAAAGLDRLAPTMPQEIDAGIATFIITDMLGALSTDASTLTTLLGDTRDELQRQIGPSNKTRQVELQRSRISTSRHRHD